AKTRARSLVRIRSLRGAWPSLRLIGTEAGPALTVRGGPRVVARIERAVAAPRSDRCERGDQRPLHDRRHERELRLVAVLLRHHGDLQRVREAAPAELALARETEELLETFLGPQGGPELDERVQLVLAVVPEPVDGTSWHQDALPS